MTSRVLNLPKKPKWWRPSYSILLIVIASILLHAWSVWLLPVDFDEPVYLDAAADYARFIRGGDLQSLIDYPENREHPPLIKILYSLPFLVFPGLNDPGLYLIMARSVSAVFGVLAVWVISRENVWAGLFLAFHSMTLKYTSQAYLEALPMLAAVLSVFSLIWSLRRKKDIYFWVSAISLGIVAASKYPYLIVSVVLLYKMLKSRKISVRKMLFYSGVAILTFFLLNPGLWNEPVQRIMAIFQFHSAYSQSAHVQNINYPWYQPIVFLATTVRWHPDVFFFLTSDEIMFFLAVVGLFFEIKERRFTAIWFLFGVVVLLLWPTKWPQYTLIVTPVAALIAGGLISRGIEWIKPRDDYWNYLEEMLPQPPKITWYLLAGFILLLVSGKVFYEFELAMARRGWNQFTSANSPLPNDSVNDLLIGFDEELIFATNNGISIWRSDSETLWGQGPEFFNTENSAIPSDRVLSLAAEVSTGSYWLGTDNGLAVLTNGDVVPIFKEEIGCQGCQINAIEIDSRKRIWLGSLEGVFVFDEGSWQDFTGDNPGISDKAVLSILVDESEEKLWTGTATGVSIYDFKNQTWENISWADNYFGWGGVADLYRDSEGRIWACTLGGGAGYWNGNDWEFLQNSNTPMRSNSVNTMMEAPNGDLWFGMSYSTEPGGYIMQKTVQDEWIRFVANNSGYQNGEPVAFVFDAQQRLWIATNGLGVQIYSRTSQ